MLILKTKTNCLFCYSLNGTFWFKKQYKLLQSLFWPRMLCFSTFLKYPLAVLAQTLTTYILMYCNASSMAFPAVHCFQFMKKTSNVRRLIWDVCCHIIFSSDVWFYMLCYITVIRRLMSNIKRLIPVNIWQHMSDVKRLASDIW